METHNVSDTWIPINDYPGDQRYDHLPSTADALHWGEIGSDDTGAWTWTIVASDGIEQWEAESGVTATEGAAKAAVEAWRPAQ
ncbi:Uncharacterised protein (plasmid) [Tsukamurella tyrosinosolvens]|uniref:Uncharacterized protein n=1 Tax=Tsukamurella tyrosinosolvens TaxID=57704 RepID=A0A1H4V810_TSUTY|nr:hypothetical protein [Tsukamurella tyrosinosolvens]KXO91036.1 hypothetical protein AXK58_21640 [Tsukamurella tyrosinosolvens]SEC76661.1 hypothetical protein SAMN04489793_3159 [Tsukamurella tyrosinosolvens]VEH90653.1 Uncharacterised protein [Tsukamurella tyrosinosolvens]